jgi:endonuclease/exonuclease/phosphatase family metal-dependent hydrolase
LQPAVDVPTGHLSPEDASSLIRSILKPRIAAFTAHCSREQLQSDLAYQELYPILKRVLCTPQCGGASLPDATVKPRYRVLAWNIERGKQFEAQVEAFRRHPYLRTCDVLLLTETDIGMARSGNRDVARAMASELGMQYVFAPCYLSLVKGSGVEREVAGENEIGLHGNAILSRYPLRFVETIPLENGIDKIASKEKRLGQQTAVAARVEFPNLAVTAVCAHLDANSSQRHRAEQMKTILGSVSGEGAVIVGGDWNTTTFNSSTAFHAIMGYWLRVIMGPDRVIRNHYLHPYRRFERELFELLESRGYEYKNSNVLGEHTISYDVDDLRTYKGLSEWVPQWCFPFIRWALRNHGGKCPLKIDWFATRGLRVESPTVIHNVREGLAVPMSDHDAIGVEIVAPEETAVILNR